MQVGPQYGLYDPKKLEDTENVRSHIITLNKVLAQRHMKLDSSVALVDENMQISHNLGLLSRSSF